MFDVASSRLVARRLSPILVVVTASVMLGACASGGASPLVSDLSSGPTQKAEAPMTELQKATAYWAKQAADNPKDPRAAVNYAKNQKAMGLKREAMLTLQQAHSANPNDRELNSEYGRLALEHDQVTLAQKLLEQADDTDWRVVSARGTVFAKQGKHGDAIAMYERALELSPGQPSVMNNLAMAHAMTGQANKAEGLLRQASAKGETDPRVQQNLALVLGLNGKHDEAKVMGADNLPVDASTHNANMVRQLVQSEETVEIAPAPAPVAQAAPAKTAKGKSAKLSTASTTAPTAVKGKAKATAATAAEPEVDASELVRRLADAAQAKKP